MIQTDNQTKLNQVFKRVFDDENLKIENWMTAKDVDGWDSMSHLQLIVSVEKEFNIKITGAEVMRLKNIGDLLELVNQKTA
ncbi:MAG TPA: acyl carrier protein [Bacteroidia bacterium]|nr:acyl carrier protein [Bacteroidia bacterium]